MIPRSPLSPTLNADALRREGLEHARRGDFALARQSLEAALRLEPGHVGALVNLGIVLQVLKDPGSAFACFEQALTLNPEIPEAWNNQSLLLSELGRHVEAMDCAERAIHLRPAYPEALNNLGRARHALGRRIKALEAYDQAVACAPAYGVAHANRAALLLEMGEAAAALESLQRARSLNPTAEFIPGLAQHVRMKLCDWRNFDTHVSALIDGLRQGQPICPPFAALALFDDPRLHRVAAEQWAQRKLQSVPDSTLTRAQRESRRIRLGYFSGDFYHHATTHLMTGLIEEHDRSRFEVFGFSFGPVANDTASERVRAAFDHFFDVRDVGDAAIAQRARELGIDIAIDLKGYTQDSRAGIFAYRAAPVQVNFLGYPGTMGGANMDYIVMDEILAPEGSEAFYSERIIRLPGSYQINDSRRHAAPNAPSRSECGLPTDELVFACFNNSYKILPAIFDSWIRILTAVPESVLWLLPDNPTARDNLRDEARQRGLAAERLIFAPRVSTAEHLARHAQADIFLDSFPYNAHTTASDALWMGMPVVTLEGRSFASRVAASLLHAVGLPELVTSTQEGYETLAIRLARDAEYRASLRAHLAAARQTSSLFDTVGFTRKWESALSQI